METTIARRKLTLLDCMVLVAAIALAASWVLVYLRAMNSYSRPGVPPGSFTFPVTMRSFALVVPFLISTTFALLILRLLPPRPSVRRLVRSPGFVFSISAPLGMVLSLTTILIAEVSRPSGQVRPLELFYLTNRFLNYSAPVITGAWFCLYVTGCWRMLRDRDWIEVSAVALGVAWQALYLAMQISR